MRPAGIHPILYAFFGPDGALDRQAMRRQVQACLAGGAHGLAVPGLATEVSKLLPAERRQVVEWAAEDLAGRVPLAVTIFGRTPAEQIEAMRHAESAGAAWVVLQPPPVSGMPEEELMRFLAPVLDAARIPAGLQNAPDLMSLGLSPENLARLAAAHPSLQVLKAEGPATLVQEVVERTSGRLAVLNGRGGLELPDNFRAGAAGMIPAPDCFDVQVQAWAAMQAGHEAEAERLYASILPAIVFAMQGVPHLVCYGKRLVAARLGLGPVHDRAPAVLPTPFGLACVRRFAAALGPYETIKVPSPSSSHGEKK